MTKTYAKDADAIARLTPEQYRVTQESGTERPFTGALTENKDAGLYVDIVSGEPLFTSMDKYDSGCGWPSFTKPVEPDHVNELRDTTHGMIRTEVRSSHAHKRPAGCAIASTRPPCGLSRWVSSRLRATASIGSCSGLRPSTPHL